MTNYPSWTTVDLTEYGTCDVNYDVIPGDKSVGLDEEYEFKVLYGGDDEDYIPEGTDITYQLSEGETCEVIAAIIRDLKDYAKRL